MKTKMSYEEFYQALEKAGHKLYRHKNGEVDNFRLDYGYHNGPECEKCQESWCKHCQRPITDCINN